ncbi:MAG: helix-turn-helix domain-containing protein, partial [Chloroflexota bacterium]|nr:helix-turn-helix domain-containing protein [Chloroflexota bacterium]
MTNEIREWMTVEEAAHVLQLGPRMVNRYGLPPYNKLRTMRKGRRVLYHRDDVHALAEELLAIRV